MEGSCKRLPSIVLYNLKLPADQASRLLQYYPVILSMIALAAHFNSTKGLHAVIVV